MGLFIWTGFDYRGEPTPFEWPSIGTQFGIMDTCGFKRRFYLNKAFFTDEPMIHILPHWNFADGEEVRVMTHTNCSEAELFLNGKSLGKRTLISTIWRIGLFRLKKVLLKWSDILTAKEVCSDEVSTANAAKNHYHSAK